MSNEGTTDKHRWMKRELWGICSFPHPDRRVPIFLPLIFLPSQAATRSANTTEGIETWRRRVRSKNRGVRKRNPKNYRFVGTDGDNSRPTC